MGLAASQARLLTITARKSDCEFQSMRYSHQKIALSRSMTDLSNEYQNSLEQTKLVYDYYGTGDENTPLSYGLLMTPSQLNGYLPTLITDASGKAVLNSQYAAAARAAGIPQEGLGCLPSSDVRNKFLQGLADSGLISQQAADTYMGIQYAQSMGMGTTDLVTTETENLTLSELLDRMSECTVDFESSGLGVSIWSGEYKRQSPIVERFKGSQEVISTTVPNVVTYKDLLTSDYTLFKVSDDNNYKYDWNQKMYQYMSLFQNWSFWDEMFENFESILDNGDPGVQQALATARSKTEAIIYVDYPSDWGGNSTDGDANQLLGTGFGYLEENWKYSVDTIGSKIKRKAHSYIGYYGQRNRGNDESNSGLSLSVSNIMRAYLTYFVAALEGAKNTGYSVDETAVTVYGTGENNNKLTDGNSRTVEESKLIGLDSNYEFTVITETGVNTDQALNSGFYDSIFNQICTRGWVENNNVNDNDYMQEMLKTGKFYLATCADDGYYYQGNYATNTYVREVTDEDAIAKAEAKYNTEKQKLTQKEEVLDLKMKNLDTEISSLTTEYDTIKSVISKNIEKSFKRYDA